MRRGGPKILSSLEAYALWARDYPPVAHNALMRTEEAAVLELLPPVAGCSVLDLGCGTGRYLSRFTDARRAVGVDSSPHMLAEAQRRSPWAECVRADVRSLPLEDGGFDVVVCGLCLGHLPSLGAPLAELARVLAPGGVAVWSCLHPFGAWAGWQRTLPDGRHAVAWTAHSYADHFAAATGAGLRIDAVLEPTGPTADGPDRPLALVIRARST